MKVRQSLTLGTLLAAAGIAFTVPLAAQADEGMMGGPRMEGRGPMGPGGRHEFGEFCGDFGDRGLRALSLTEEQKDKIFKLRHDAEPGLRDKFKELRAAHENLEALTHAPTYDEARVRAVTEKSATVLADLARLNARTEFQIYQVLTPEQKKQLEDFKNQRGGMGPGGPGMRPGPGMRQGPGTGPQG